MQIARAALEGSAVDHSTDLDAFREDLLNIARTTLSSKLLHGEKDHFAKLAVDAVLRLKGSGNLDHIQVTSRLQNMIIICYFCIYIHRNFVTMILQCLCSHLKDLYNTLHPIHYLLIVSATRVQVIKKPGGTIADSFLEEGFVLDKSFGVGQPRRVENPRILIANTPMDTDKIKIYGSRVRIVIVKPAVCMR